MSGATHEQVNLMLKLYELRREPKLRAAREWMGQNFQVQNLDDVMQVCPPGSQENAFMRMTLGYWDMVAGIVNRGLVDEEMFFETTGELWNTWEQVKPVIGGWRAMFSSQTFLKNIEESAQKMEAWREKKNPGSNAAIRKVLEQMKQATKPAKAQAA
jgi:hypothetical protein